MKKRLAWLDNLRGFAILLVVLGHCLQYFMNDFDTNHLANYIYSFHMPLFFAMSGFVSYKDEQSGIVGLNSVIKKRSVQLLVPYMFWSLVLCLVLRYDVIKVIVTTPIYWFLILLFFIIILYEIGNFFSAILKIRFEYVEIGIFCILAIVNKLIPLHVFSMELLYFYFLFYIIGAFLKKHIEVFDNKKISIGVMLVCIIFFIVFGYCYRKNSGPLYFEFVPQSFFFMITGMLGTMVFFLLFKLFGDNRIGFLGLCGRMSLGIYVVQALLCHMVKAFIQNGLWASNSYLIVFIMWILITIVSLVVSSTLKKYKVTALLVGERQ